MGGRIAWKQPAAKRSAHWINAVLKPPTGRAGARRGSRASHSFRLSREGIKVNGWINCLSIIRLRSESAIGIALASRHVKPEHLLITEPDEFRTSSSRRGRDSGPAGLGTRGTRDPRPRDSGVGTRRSRACAAHPSQTVGQLTAGKFKTKTIICSFFLTLQQFNKTKVLQATLSFIHRFVIIT